MTMATTPAPSFKTIFIPLLALFSLCAAVLVVTDHYTRDKIAKNARDVELRSIDSVMPLPHDNDLHEDYMDINDPVYFSINPNVTVFRARQGKQPAGVVLMPVTATGYSGKILLAVGIACAVKNSGIGNGAIETGKCRLVVEADGSVGLYSGFTEMGQGLLTVITQFAVEVTGLPASVFRPQVNSRFELGSGQTTGSRGTLLAGRATIDAAAKLSPSFRPPGA